MHPFAVSAVKDRLIEAGGGCEIVHDSPGLEVGVYVLVAYEQLSLLVIFERRRG
jgi:hypothetical protein